MYRCQSQGECGREKESRIEIQVLNCELSWRHLYESERNRWSTDYLGQANAARCTCPTRYLPLLAALPLARGVQITWSWRHTPTVPQSQTRRLPERLDQIGEAGLRLQYVHFSHLQQLCLVQIVISCYRHFFPFQPFCTKAVLGARGRRICSLPFLQVMNLHLSTKLFTRPSLSPLGSRSFLSHYRPYSSPTTASKSSAATKHQPGGQGDRLRFFPFLILFLLSSGSYVFLVRRRVGSQATVSSENRRKAHTER